MEEKATLMETLIEKAEVYTKSSIDLLTLRAVSKSANVLSSLVGTIIVLVAALCAIFMVNIGAALWICELIGSSFWGFFIVAFFYIIMAGVLWSFRGVLLTRPLVNYFITQIRLNKNI